jgi:hypothetical protein
MITTIQSREAFILFTKQLAADFNTHPQDWENSSVDRFLEAIGGWVESMDGYYRLQGIDIPPDLDWTMIARILLAAKSYE